MHMDWRRQWREGGRMWELQSLEDAVVVAVAALCIDWHAAWVRASITAGSSAGQAKAGEGYLASSLLVD